MEGHLIREQEGSAAGTWRHAGPKRPRCATAAAAAVTRRSADLCYAELRLKLAVLCEVGIIRTSMCQGDANRAVAAAAAARTK